MLNFLKVARYLVFVVFIISNAIVTSVAVWNLSIVEGSWRFSATETATASYLIAIAAMGLLLIFPILFLEIAGKKAFLCRVWFELAWVGLFGLMTLIGAALVSTISRELCVATSVTSDSQVSLCSSAQVLSAFTWIPAILLIAYMALLAILTSVRSREDPGIWKCLVRDLPLDQNLDEVDQNSIPQTRKSLVIHAPRPKHIIPPLLDCRSARNSAYDPQLPAMPAKAAPVREMSSWYRPSVAKGPDTSTSFYNPSVQKAMVSARAPPPPPPVQPPPLGDWPRLDATSRPRTKRYPRTVPLAQGPPAPEPSTVPQHSSRNQAPSAAPAVPYRTSPTRRPPGSGRLGSVDSTSGGHRPPPLDLSKISSYRTRSQRSGSRAGR